MQYRRGWLDSKRSLRPWASASKTIAIVSRGEGVVLNQHLGRPFWLNLMNLGAFFIEAYSRCWPFDTLQCPLSVRQLMTLRKKIGNNGCISWYKIRGVPDISIFCGSASLPTYSKQKNIYRLINRSVIYFWTLFVNVFLFFVIFMTEYGHLLVSSEQLNW